MRKIIIISLICLTSFNGIGQTFKPCLEKVAFSVSDNMLVQKIGILDLPDTNPFYEGGIEELKEYFSIHPLKGTHAKDLVFRAHIGFIVSCDGKMGEIQLLSSPKGDLVPLSKELVEIVNKIPQYWRPAVKDGKAVDCYQILSFTIIGGALERTVSYR